VTVSNHTLGWIFNSGKPQSVWTLVVIWENERLSSRLRLRLRLRLNWQLDVCNCLMNSDWIKGRSLRLKSLYYGKNIASFSRSISKYWFTKKPLIVSILLVESK
jgi:hypothetical protein